MNKQKHLVLDTRITIEQELSKNTSFKTIGMITGKDCTTISKEIRGHITHEKTGTYGVGFNDCLLAFQHKCISRHMCRNCMSRSKRFCWSCGKCISSCTQYIKYTCPRLSKPPYVCNGCSERSKCSLEKSVYRAAIAQREYDLLKSESRSGFSVSEDEIRSIDGVLSPLLQNGQSIHHICINHADELMTSERTLYTYVNNGLFSSRNIDMPRTIRMRPRKVKSKPLKVDKRCRIDRTFSDYQSYIKEHSDVPVQQLDSVEGIRGGAVLLTIHFVKQELQLAFLRQANDSQSVIDVFNKLYLEMHPDVFVETFSLLLADNGSEFSNPNAIEFDQQGNRRTRMFYCNPNAPYEKSNCENNHEMIRKIIPKGVDIGQYCQQQIDLMMSHINSYARKSLGNKSPYDVFAFQYGEELLKLFNLKRIPADEIILTPKLLTRHT